MAGTGVEGQTCTVCMCTIDARGRAEGAGVAWGGCGHATCAECTLDAMAHFVNATNDRTVRCAGADGHCGASLSNVHAAVEAMVRARHDLGAAGLLGRYERVLALRNLAAVAQVVWCAGEGCGGAVVVDNDAWCAGGGDAEAGGRGHAVLAPSPPCAECACVTCVRCGALAESHAQPWWRTWVWGVRRTGSGGGACPDAGAGDAASRAWLRAHSVACPTCGVALMRAGGCRHARCGVCATEACFECGEEYHPLATARCTPRDTLRFLGEMPEGAAENAVARRRPPPFYSNLALPPLGVIFVLVLAAAVYVAAVIAAGSLTNCTWSCYVGSLVAPLYFAARRTFCPPTPKRRRPGGVLGL